MDADEVSVSTEATDFVTDFDDIENQIIPTINRTYPYLQDIKVPTNSSRTLGIVANRKNPT